MIKGTKQSKTIQPHTLDRINPMVAGLDIGSRSVYACAGLANGEQEVREFPMFTADLKAMVAWLKQHGNKSVAMESTGSYWIPVYDILAEAGIEVYLVNAHHLRTVPGRKTDVKDCQWIRQLHSYGLLQGSFRPADKCVALRTHVRHRSRIVESAATQAQLMYKALIQMNLQLTIVISDITGVTGMRIIRAIVAGERDPKELAAFRDGRCKSSKEEIAKALEGNYRPELIFALKQGLEAYDFFHAQIESSEKEIEHALESLKDPSEDHIKIESNQEVAMEAPKKGKKTKNKVKTASSRSSYSFDAADKVKQILGIDLTDIPGIDGNTLVKILAEIGTDMNRWKDSKHFASWLGLCPANKISGGKVLSSKTKPSANRAAQAFRLSANTLYNSKTALGAFFRRMKARLGTPKAITATAHKLAVILYTMIRDRKPFNEFGQDAYERNHKDRLIRNLRRKAGELGLTLVEAAPQAS